jgi:geranylgeranylglycerol-phosphate geranylgeranyltransferase
MPQTPARGLVALLRLPYWLMTGGLSLLTALAITKASLPIETAVLTFFSMAFITSAGFAINDYYDRESDAVIKPKRPLPSGALTLRQVIAVSAVLFAVGLALAVWVNMLSLLILAIDSALLLLYSAVVKRKSGFAANILVGLLTGTAFLYGEAVTLGANAVSPLSLSLVSLSLYPIAFGTIGGNILRDILSSEGDAKVGYPTLPQTVGNRSAISIAAVFFALTAILSPLPYFLGFFNVYYLVPILIWGLLLLYASLRLMTSAPTIDNVKKYERFITMSMMLLILSLILEAFIK